MASSWSGNLLPLSPCTLAYRCVRLRRVSSVLLQNRIHLAVNVTSSSAPFFDIVVIATSTGGLSALREIVCRIPPYFPTPIVIVQHLSDGYESPLAELLGRCSNLRVDWIRRGGRLSGGRIYVAAPGTHVRMISAGECESFDGPRINFVRPSADILFDSAAEHYGCRALGIVLTGRLADGSRGAEKIRRAGGVVIAQHPDTCVAEGMPRSVIKSGAANFVLSPRGIASALISLVTVPGSLQIFGVSSEVQAVA